MPNPVFNRLYTAVVARSEYLRRGMRPDATGIEISPLLKVIIELRSLAHALRADLFDEMFDVCEITASQCVQAFCKAVTE